MFRRFAGLYSLKYEVCQIESKVQDKFGREVLPGCKQPKLELTELNDIRLPVGSYVISLFQRSGLMKSFSVTASH